MDKPLLIDRNVALKSQDSPYQTYGCRHYNPNICKIMVWKIFTPLSKQIISAKSLQEVGQNNTKN